MLISRCSNSIRGTAHQGPKKYVSPLRLTAVNRPYRVVFKKKKHCALVCFNLLVSIVNQLMWQINPAFQCSIAKKFLSGFARRIGMIMRASKPDGGEEVIEYDKIKEFDLRGFQKLSSNMCNAQCKVGMHLRLPVVPVPRRASWSTWYIHPCESSVGSSPRNSACARTVTSHLRWCIATTACSVSTYRPVGQIPVASLLIEVRSPLKVVTKMFHPVDQVFTCRRSSFPVLASFITSPWAKCGRLQQEH